MAGDWIKLQTVTPDKPEVFRMAMDLGIAPEHVLGCLVRVWIWADQQTLQGNAVTVTGVTLDRIACYAGFAAALKNVGWLTGDDMDFCFPNFDRHNGETAKTRAQTAKRVERHRSNGVTQKPLPEKRREENKEPPVAPPSGGHAARGTRLPSDWQLPKSWGDWALSDKPEWTESAVRAVAEAFADHWHSKPGRDGVKLNWEATWRNWIRREPDRPRNSTPALSAMPRNLVA
ncbi:MAG: hypothetical protein KGH75_10430 [Rhodospirillales bacterium]|nr:hypothetical protein [Rhodospirillales bacterium]